MIYFLKCDTNVLNLRKKKKIWAEVVSAPIMWQLFFLTMDIVKKMDIIKKISVLKFFSILI